MTDGCMVDYHRGTEDIVAADRLGKNNGRCVLLLCCGGFFVPFSKSTGKGVWVRLYGKTDGTQYV